MVTRSSLSIALATLVTFAALACTPAKAPGSNPEDMTPEEHQKAAEDEKAKALQDAKTPPGTATKDDHSIKNE